MVSQPPTRRRVSALQIRVTTLCNTPRIQNPGRYTSMQLGRRIPQSESAVTLLHGMYDRSGAVSLEERAIGLTGLKADSDICT